MVHEAILDLDKVRFFFQKIWERKKNQSQVREKDGQLANYLKENKKIKMLCEIQLVLAAWLTIKASDPSFIQDFFIQDFLTKYYFWFGLNLILVRFPVQKV